MKAPMESQWRCPSYDHHRPNLRLWRPLYIPGSQWNEAPSHIMTFITAFLYIALSPYLSLTLRFLHACCRMLIGAPRANVSATSHSGKVHPGGALYRCVISPGRREQECYAEIGEIIRAFFFTDSFNKDSIIVLFSSLTDSECNDLWSTRIWRKIRFTHRSCRCV